MDGRRLILVEPRRLAARAAAARLAASLGEEVGKSVAIRARFETRASAASRIEVVTEGVLVRMILDDPGLEGVAAILFDEFHERSLDADLGLALALDARILAAGPAAARDVGDARRRAGGAAFGGYSVRCGARRRIAGPRLPRRDALPRPRPGRADRRCGHPRDCAGAGGRGRLDPRLPARPRRDPAHRGAPRCARPAGERDRRAAVLRDGSARAGCGDPAGAAGRAKDRPGDVDRRDLADDRRRARGRRFGGGARAASTSRPSA